MLAWGRQSMQQISCAWHNSASKLLAPLQQSVTPSQVSPTAHPAAAHNHDQLSLVSQAHIKKNMHRHAIQQMC